MYAQLFSSFPSTSVTYHNQYGDRLPKKGWSKWGGGLYGLDKEELDEWYCQTCGEKQTKTLPSYMFPVDTFKRDFVRVCSECKAKATQTNTSFCFDLIEIVKTF